MNADRVTLNDNMRRLPLPPSEDICTTWWSFLSEYQSCNWAQGEETWCAHRGSGRPLSFSLSPSIPPCLTLSLPHSLCLSLSLSCTHTHTHPHTHTHTHTHTHMHHRLKQCPPFFPSLGTHNPSLSTCFYIKFVSQLSLDAHQLKWVH